MCQGSFFVFLCSQYHLLTSCVMPSYDRSSHTPIQVTVNILYLLTVLLNFTVVGLFLITGYYTQGVRQARLYSISITKELQSQKFIFCFLPSSSAKMLWNLLGSVFALKYSGFKELVSILQNMLLRFPRSIAKIVFIARCS